MNQEKTLQPTIMSCLKVTYVISAVLATVVTATVAVIDLYLACAGLIPDTFEIQILVYSHTVIGLGCFLAWWIVVVVLGCRGNLNLKKFAQVHYVCFAGLMITPVEIFLLPWTVMGTAFVDPTDTDLIYVYCYVSPWCYQVAVGLLGIIGYYFLFKTSKQTVIRVPATCPTAQTCCVCDGVEAGMVYCTSNVPHYTCGVCLRKWKATKPDGMIFCPMCRGEFAVTKTV